MGRDELRAEVSLVDELAADSLDLLELVLAAEGEFGITIPERILDDVRTYGDLLAVVSDGLRRSHAASAAAEPVPVWARIVGPARATLERTAPLTPYLAETIAEDALHAGDGTRLEVEMPAGTSEVELLAVRECFERFARLGARGVQVRVRRAPFARSSASVSARASASR